MKNALISVARSAYYAATEPRRLKNARLDNLDGWAGVWNRGDPLVSVIIPTHNRTELLTRAVSSVLHQDYRNIEVLVCAHGCTDGTEGHVRALGDSRIRVLSVPRRQTYPATARNHWLAGPVDPINVGLVHAKGRFFARIDDDDEWAHFHLDRLVRFAQNGNHEFVSSAYLTNDRVVHHDDGKPPIGGVQTWVWRSYLRFMRANPDCYRKRWNAVNDTDLADRFRRAGVRIGHLDEVTAYVFPRPGETVIGLKAYQQNRAETERRLAFR